MPVEKPAIVLVCAIAWVSAEFPGIVRGVEATHPPKTDESDISKVAVVWFPGNGEPERRDSFGWSHNHGEWLDWPQRG